MNVEKMTRQQAQEEMNALKRIFPLVEVFDKDEIEKGNVPSLSINGKAVRCARSVAESAQEHIENVLSRMDGTQAELLELMYLDGKKLNEAAEEIHYSYRQACRLHGKALLSAAEIMDNDVL